ncbi:hypothetical protein BGW42_006127 [Actinomortierella wolfii]|nr:hypothetical protein BGW42_006127 [Actinomortierella wolfii]
MSMYKWAISDPSPGSTSQIKTTTTAATTVPTTTIRGGIGRDGNPRAGILVPIFGYMTILTMLFIPLNILFIKERYRFLRSMKKVCFTGFNTPVTFSDVILADILTSFARVFGDLAVVLCLMFWSGSSTEACFNSILVPIMTSVPYFIRLRQCLTEYKDSHYKVKRHFMNALKYASAFPVIMVSYMQKVSKNAAVQGAANQSVLSDNALYRLWLFFVALNSFYSFYWDIKHDWMLIERVPGGAGGIAGYSNGFLGSEPSMNGFQNKGTSTATSKVSSSLVMPASPKMPPTGTTANSSSNSSGNSNHFNTHLTTQGGTMNPFASSLPAHHHHYYPPNKRGLFTIMPTFSFTSPRTWWPWFRQRSGLSSFRMRHYLHYEEAYFYMFAIVLDFLLRTTWMMKVFGNFQIEEYEGGVFTMQCLEVLRRWVWVLFRLEAEMVKRQGPNSGNNSPVMQPTSDPFFVGGAGGGGDGMENDQESIPLTTKTNPSSVVNTSATTSGTAVSSSNIDLSMDAAKMEKSAGSTTHGGSHLIKTDMKNDR